MQNLRKPIHAIRFYPDGFGMKTRFRTQTNLAYPTGFKPQTTYSLTLRILQLVMALGSLVARIRGKAF